MDELDHCSCCNVDVLINVKKLQEHYTSKFHRNKHTIINLLSLFTKHGMDWMGTKRKFYCVYHKCKFEAKAKVLIEHLKEHREVEEVTNISSEEDFGPRSLTISVFRHKLWKVDLQSINTWLNI